MTLEFLLPPKQSTDRDRKMNSMEPFNFNFNGGNPFHVLHRLFLDWKWRSVTKQIGGRLYDVSVDN
jgi:hypothetical protein